MHSRPPSSVTPEGVCARGGAPGGEVSILICVYILVHGGGCRQVYVVIYRFLAAEMQIVCLLLQRRPARKHRGEPGRVDIFIDVLLALLIAEEQIVGLLPRQLTDPGRLCAFVVVRRAMTGSTTSGSHWTTLASLGTRSGRRCM